MPDSIRHPSPPWIAGQAGQPLHLPRHAPMLQIFTSDVIDTWIDYKRKREIDPVRLRPHPWEFYLYFDI